jgi:nicotinate-nucleotide adenylyltransferase
MKIGLFFGTFNPIHVGHLIIADHFAQYSDLDQVWLVVSPRNPLKGKDSLLKDHHRLAMVRVAVEDNPLLKASDIEFKLDKPSYTVNTLAYLKDQHPEHHFCLIMGEDNLRSLDKWKNHEYILDHHEIYVYPRDAEGDYEPEIGEVKVVNAPRMNISASAIRTAIAEGKDVRYLLSKEVYEYLIEMHFYEK